LFFSFVAITVSPAKQEDRRTGIQAGMTASGIRSAVTQIVLALCC
jgi:hypothetical protein